MSNLRTIYQMKLTQINDLTPTVKELVIETTNPSEFSFRAGQFVMLHVPTQPKATLRAYSIASTEKNKAGFRLLFKFVEGGIASTFVWSLRGGETLQFTGPFGRVFFQEPPTEQIVMLNTGTGLAQHFSYLASKIEQYPNLKYKLFFGIRSENEIYYRQELDELKKHLPNFEYHYVISRPSEKWTGKKGYVQHFIDETGYKTTPTTFYLCGNGGMIKEVKAKLLEQEGFDKSRLFTEAFD